MRLTTSTIALHGLRLHAFHGVMAQERSVGADFIVDLQVDYDFSAAMQSDRVGDTVSYADLYALVKAEMAQPSNLLEHVAYRIAQRVLKDYPQVLAVDVKLTKLNPPMGADCDGASVEVHFVNNK